MIEKIHGLDALHAALQALPVKVEKNILRGMIRAACRPIVERARELAPTLQEPDARREPGALKKSVRTMSTSARNGTVRGGVAAGGRLSIRGRLADAFYGFFDEYGTKGMAPQPFMRPAADERANDAVEAGAHYARERVNAGDAG